MLPLSHPLKAPVYANYDDDISAFLMQLLV